MDVVRLCSELIRIRSDNPPGNTEDITEYIRNYLECLGVGSTLVRGPGGRCSLVTNGGRKPLLFCGHVDVVPALPERWTHDPLSGTIENRFVWGRGATDMKGGCAALLTAYRSSIEKGIEPPVCLVFVCDEETGGKYGIQRLIAKRMISPCDCLIAEPTAPLHPSIGQKGLLRFTATFAGVPAHASLYPNVGVSAIMEAFGLLETIKELHQREYPVDPVMQDIIRNSSRVLGEIFGMPGLDNVLRKIMYNPGTIRGGEKANIVAQHCSLELDMRLPWGCDPEDVFREIQASAGSATFSLQNMSGPTFTPQDRDIVRVTCDEIAKQYHGVVSPIVQWAASDARYLRKAGFNVIEYGPGEITTLHAIDEHVSIGSLHRAVAIYEGIMAAYRNDCGPGLNCAGSS